MRCAPWWPEECHRDLAMTLNSMQFLHQSAFKLPDGVWSWDSWFKYVVRPASVYLLAPLYSINQGQMLDSEHSAGNDIQLVLNNTT